jgi:fructosamine-3-kinase
MPHSGAVAIDPAPCFGHPEIDLALIDYFEAVPPDVFDARREIAHIDAGFAQRRELWRIFAYLAWWRWTAKSRSATARSDSCARRCALISDPVERRARSVFDGRS